MKRKPIMYANGKDIVGQVRILLEEDLNDPVKVEAFNAERSKTAKEKL